MIDKSMIQKQIPYALRSTDLGIGEKYQGKVRDRYIAGEKIFLITTDRISAFDVILTTIPFKGQVLNQISSFWFEKTKDIVSNHVISVPDPNVVIARKVSILPIEVVVRGYLTGSAWRDYTKGNAISGIRLPPGMKKDEKFAEPLLTPSTKAEKGHDLPISAEEIVSKGILAKGIMQQVKEKAILLFTRGQEVARKNGMILVDTKYEFGLDEKGKLVLADELHTPDSSRYWYADTYEGRFAKGEEQRMLDKEYLRQWLIKEKNFMGDGPIPKIPEDIIVEVSRKYIQIYEEITGLPFQCEVGDVMQRIRKNLKI